MGFNGSRAQTTTSAKAKTPYQHHPIQFPCGRCTQKGCPRVDGQHLKATWEKATGPEEQPAAAGQAGEIPAGKQKPRLELEPCRKFGGCLVSQHLVNTSCGWRLTSSSTTPPSSHTHHPAFVRGPQSAIEEQGERQPGENTAPASFSFGFGFFFPLCKKSPEHLFLCSLKFQDTLPAIQTPSWHSKQQYILYNWFFFCCFYHFIKPYNELQRIQHLYNGKTTAE